MIRTKQTRIEFFFVRRIRRQTRRYPDRLRSMTSLYDDTANDPGVRCTCDPEQGMKQLSTNGENRCTKARKNINRSGVANMRIPLGMGVRTGAHWRLLNARVVTGQLRHDMHSTEGLGARA